MSPPAMAGPTSSVELSPLSFVLLVGQEFLCAYAITCQGARTVRPSFPQGIADPTDGLCLDA